MKVTARESWTKNSCRRSAGKPLSVPLDEGLTLSVWHEATAAADRFNEPGVFTTFSGYEWTSMPNDNNLHRNVIFKDGAELVNQVAPFSALDSVNVEDLWEYLAEYVEKTGGDVLAIPHNSNLSNGLMFSDKMFDGRPITREYAQTRAYWEPVIEVTQVKGDSEAHPLLSPNDEFADYGTWDDGNIWNSAGKKPEMLRYEYARSALKLGLELNARIGANPYQFGLGAGTDSHTALATADEDNWFGKLERDDAPGPDRAETTLKIGRQELWTGWEMLASGYMAVWATQNTREALFDAMRRREVYATTGPRITLRVYAGWEFDERDVRRPDHAAFGYKTGVPMGAILDARPAGNDRAPGLMITASRDPPRCKSRPGAGRQGLAGCRWRGAGKSL